MNSLLIVVLDRSESMLPRADATRSGFNEFLTAQQYRQDDCTFFMAQFAAEYEVTHNFVSVFTVPILDRIGYYPTGSATALYDAINTTIAAVYDHLATLPAEEQPGQITCVIQTDGCDNFSLNNYSNMGGIPTNRQKQADIRAKTIFNINKCKLEGWTFIFLACESRAAGEAKALTLEPEEVIVYNDVSAGSVFGQLAERVYDTMFERETP